MDVHWNSLLVVTKKYLGKHWIQAVFAFYFVASVVMKSLHIIDITIPCPIRYFSGYKCPGCGLTTALMQSLRFDFKAAWDSNWLAFIVFPALFFYFVKDLISYYKKELRLLKVKEEEVNSEEIS